MDVIMRIITGGENEIFYLVGCRPQSAGWTIVYFAPVSKSPSGFLRAGI
jgi:hypothetical protein